MCPTGCDKIKSSTLYANINSAKLKTFCAVGIITGEAFQKCQELVLYMSD